MSIRPFFLNVVALAVIMAAAPLAAQSQPDTPTMGPPQFRPARFTGKLTPYDLSQVVKENQAKQAARQGYNYSSFLVTEFSEHYYPKADFQWHRVGGFRHVGLRNLDENTAQEVCLSWISLSDGLQWGFFNAEIRRTRKGDPFAIITNDEAANRIKQNLRDRDLLAEENEVTDVFRYQSRSITTDQKTSGINFPDKGFTTTKFGVAVDDKTYFFTPSGEVAESPR